MSLLITTSLVGSVRWRKNCTSPDWVAKAETDLKNQLGRVWVELPKDDARSRGTAFEDAVYAEAKSRSHPDKGSEHFRWFVDECAGAQFQRVISVNAPVDGHDVCFYGKIDAWFPDVLKDLKTTTSWKGPQKYLDSFQHVVYCWAEKIYRFRYIVAVFGPDGKIAEHHGVDWAAPEPDVLDLEVKDGAREVLDFLKERPDLWELYVNKFCKHATEEEKKPVSKFKMSTSAAERPVETSAAPETVPATYTEIKVPPATPAHLVGQREEVTEDSLAKLAKLVERQRELDREADELKEQLKEKQEALRKVSQEEIPNLMHEHGLSQIKLKDGSKVEVKENVSVSVPEDKEEAFWGFLKERNAEDLIKMQFSFGRMLPSTQKALFSFLSALEVEYDVKKGVHPQTLAKYFRDLLGVGLEDDERKALIAAGSVLRADDVKDVANLFVFFDTKIKDPK